MWWAESGPEFAAFAEVDNPYFYNRHGTPNNALVAAIIAELEGAETAVMTGSGMGAAATAVLTLVKAGDHVVGQRSMYASVTSIVEDLLPRLGVETTQVDQRDTDAFREAMRPNTTLVLLESPSNPLLQITDLEAVATLARERGALTLMDNTFATPINQQPLRHGIDLVWHSATKYLGGHADLMAGAILGSREHVERIWHTLQMTGAVLSPFNAWLLLRGLRTLEMRVERHNANAQAIAEFLARHPAVAAVHYPGLPGHDLHDVARRQMSGFGGVLSFELEGGYDVADAFLDRLVLTRRASSLGHVGSLAVHPAALFAAVRTPEQLAEAGVRPGLIRFSAGIESTADLLADIEAALPG
jgi:methionine-gamma-lyase